MWTFVLRVTASAVIGGAIGYGIGKTYRYVANRQRKKNVASASKEATKETPEAIDLPKDTNRFTAAYEAAQDTPYDAQWENGTGYLDHAIHFVKANAENDPGTLYRTKDPQGRKILIIPISEKHGSVVIFERYPITSLEQTPLYALHYPKPLHPFVAELSRPLSDHDLIILIGDVVEGGSHSGIRDRFLDKKKPTG